MRKREWGLRATKMCRKKFDGNGKRKKGGKTVERPGVTVTLKWSKWAVYCMAQTGSNRS
jgi:hypothetical protein